MSFRVTFKSAESPYLREHPDLFSDGQAALEFVRGELKSQPVLYAADVHVLSKEGYPHWWATQYRGDADPLTMREVVENILGNKTSHGAGAEETS